MNTRLTRIALGIGAAAIAFGLGAGTMAATQNPAGDQPPVRGGRGMGPMGPGPGGFAMLGPIRRLNPTDAQKDQVKNILDSHAGEFKALGERSRTAHEALRAALSADPIDDAAIRQKSAEVAAVQADMAVAGAHVRAEVLQVLTAEQREELKKLQAQRPERGRPGRPVGPRRGGRR